MRRAFEDYATGRLHEGTTAETGQSLGPHESARQAAHVTGDRRAAAQPALRRNCGRAGYGVRGKRGDFEPLVSEELFYRVQAILSGRTPSTAPQQRAHPDFPLRGFVRCESCGRGLTGSWSKGRSEYLRVLPLPSWLSRGQRDEGEARRVVRRRTRPAAANAWLHAAAQGIRSGRSWKVGPSGRGRIGQRVPEIVTTRDSREASLLFEVWRDCMEKLREEESTHAGIDRLGQLNELDMEGSWRSRTGSTARRILRWLERQRFQQLS